MSVEPGRSAVHLIVKVLGDALRRLPTVANPLDVEQRGFVIHRAISSRAREFHTHQHVLELAREVDPLGVLGALYHDIVYVQVDQGLPAPVAPVLAPFLAQEGPVWRVLPEAGLDPLVADVLTVFGKAPGDTLTPFTGLNELASAIVAARELGGLLNRVQRVAVAACIEATIPFREDVGGPLAQRLEALGLTPPVVMHVVTLAVRLANADVANFADDDPSRFLDNTWKLLPETNPSLHTPATYTVSEYRVALQKMEGFLATLPARRIFHHWGGEPPLEEHERRVAAATRNLSLAVRYLRQKLYSIAVVEALAEATGGDMPLEYLMGGIPTPGAVPQLRVEAWLPEPAHLPVDPELQGLLAQGRASASRFDTAPSPLAAFLHASLGEERTVLGLEEARSWWAGQTSAWAFLRAQPLDPVLHIADTRAEALRYVAAGLRVGR